MPFPLPGAAATTAPAPTRAVPPVMPCLISAPDLIAADLPPRRTILDPILSTKSLALLYGPRGLGKTFVALGIAWAAASGGSFLGWQASRAHRVVYVDGEMAAVDMQERLRMLGSMPPTLKFLLADLNPDGLGLPDLANVRGQAELAQNWGDAKPDLLVLDNLASLVGFDGNDPDAWNGVQRFLMALRRIDMSVLLVHHANKDGLQRGTSRREDVLDIVMALRRPVDYEPTQGARFEIHFEKARGLYGPATEPIEARLASDALGVARWRWRAAQIGAFERVVDLLKEGLNPNQIAMEFGIARATTYRMRKRAVEMGLLG